MVDLIKENFLSSNFKLVVKKDNFRKQKSIHLGGNIEEYDAFSIRFMCFKRSCVRPTAKRLIIHVGLCKLVRMICTEMACTYKSNKERFLMFLDICNVV